MNQITLEPYGVWNACFTMDNLSYTLLWVIKSLFARCEGTKQVFFIQRTSLLKNVFLKNIKL